MPGTPVALTIAGSDPSGGAGLQADLKVFQQFGVYGEAVVTLATVQNTRRVSAVHCLPSGLVSAQISAVVEDIPPCAAKTGALGNREIVEAVADAALRFSFPLVVDPVLISKHGASLMADDARAALVRLLIPRSFLVTPNLPEASALTSKDVSGVASMREAAQAIAGLGARSVLIKGGHLTGGEATDLLYCDGKFHQYSSARVDTIHTHGTGCSYSAAITALLALGYELPEAVARAKDWISRAIADNPGLGGGSGPVNHHTPAPI
ncbi:MAG TPA: bifunctional hydroxymethylpyrimidine kinase/phosphomethylpyrimidine kinase [Bryobacteraceae bacterium]|jgi:hydroxymethylpyrimidine/phosphomethylpyrimidine kinase|nr:bifunctional hydroxymethylpyrimidine kinase/phosphomethylpyrimidine kinase [Bryobacteraceae bacterium]